MAQPGTLYPSRTTGVLDATFLSVRRFVRSMGEFLALIVILLVAVAAGLGSAWYMIDRGTALTIDRIGPWQSWSAEGNPEADPYTRAHLAREGRLSVTSTAARYFLARNDSEGRVLSSACEYLVEGPPIEAKWWSIALFNENGHLLENEAERYGFNSAEIVRRTDGSHGVTIAREARSENWLPAGDTKRRRLTIWLSIYMPATTVGAGFVAEQQLPAIRRIACR